MYVQAILRGGKVAYFRECTITCGTYTEKCELVPDKRNATKFTAKEADEILNRKDYNLRYYHDAVDIVAEE